MHLVKFKLKYSVTTLSSILNSRNSTPGLKKKESLMTSDPSTVISLLYLTLYHKVANVYVRKTNKIVNTGENKISMSIREIKKQQRNKQRLPQQIL